MIDLGLVSQGEGRVANTAIAALGDQQVIVGTSRVSGINLNFNLCQISNVIKFCSTLSCRESLVCGTGGLVRATRVWCANMEVGVSKYVNDKNKN